LRKRGSLRFATPTATGDDSHRINHLQDPLSHEYRLKLFAQIFFYAIGGLLVAAGIALLATLVLVPARDGTLLYQLLAFAFGLMLLGAWALIHVSRLRVVLSADSIVVHRAFTTKRMSRNEIAGRRVNPAGYGNRRIELFRDAEGEAALTLPLDLGTDAYLDEWLSAFVDLDANESQASLDAFLADESMAGSNEDRMQELGEAERVARVFRWVTATSFIWLAIFPHPYGAAILVAVSLPWIALILAAVGGRAYRMSNTKNEVGASLWEPLLLPGVALAIRVMYDIEVFDWAKATGLTAMGAGVCTGMCLWFAPSLRPRNVLIPVIVSMLMYAFGVSMLANQLFDRSESAVYETRVLSRHIDKEKSTTYFLHLAPWGPRAEDKDIKVSQRFFDDNANAATVCVHVWRGAMGVRWFEVRACGRDAAGARRVAN
jgi:hypothetical protein